MASSIDEKFSATVTATTSSGASSTYSPLHDLEEGLADAGDEGMDDLDKTLLALPLQLAFHDDSSSTTSEAIIEMETPAKATAKGYSLRWSRIEKVVEVQDASASGFMGRSSISTRRTPDATTNTSSANSAPGDGSARGFLKKSMTTKKLPRTILNNVSGCAHPGEVLALMGPSGSSKTTLLNCLSGRASFDSGVVSINGVALTRATMKRVMSKVAYVKQFDVFFPHLTVRDQLTYTALLRLPMSMTKAQKHEEVERIIQLLFLHYVADAPIFLVSGGERKRVNIGTELLTNPQILMLDEPISGLDSSAAVGVLSVLQSLARDHHKTIITSIHQPSSYMFQTYFDKLIMLSEGHVVYFGRPMDSLEYLASEQLLMPCPPGYNLADHWMDCLVVNTSNPPLRWYLQQAWDNDAVAEEMDQALIHHTTTENTEMMEHSLTAELGQKYQANWWTQYTVLTHRALKSSRSAIFTPLNLAKSLAIGVIVGLLWFQTEYTESRVYDLRSYFFFTTTYWVFDSMYTALSVFPSERCVVMKERSSGSYHLSAYFMAKTTADAPVLITLPILYLIVSFWMAGIDDRFHVFMGTLGATLLSVSSGEAIGLFVGAAIYDLLHALAVLTVFALGLMLLGGFYLSKVPPFVAWAKYLSPFKYAFDFSSLLLFDKDVPCDGSWVLDSLCGGRNYGTAAAKDVQAYLGIQGSMFFNLGMLLLLSIVPRFFAYLALSRKREAERA